MSDLSAEAITAHLTTHRFGRPTYFFPEIGSTMPEARRLAELGEPEGTLVIADAQTAGRGRHGRTWLSEAGVNLTFSLVLWPTLAQLRGLAIATSLAGVEAVRAQTGLPARIKWPNDLVIHDRKFAGILIDSEVQGAEVAHTILGIGLNVNLDVARFPDLAGIATSLAAEAGRSFDRLALLVDLLARLERRYDQLLTGPSLLPEWIAASATLGRRIRASSPAGVETGLAEAIDEEGALLLRRDDGSIARLLAAEVSLSGQ